MPLYTKLLKTSRYSIFSIICLLTPLFLLLSIKFFLISLLFLPAFFYQFTDFLYFITLALFPPGLKATLIGVITSGQLSGNVFLPGINMCFHRGPQRLLVIGSHFPTLYANKHLGL